MITTTRVKVLQVTVRTTSSLASKAVRNAAALEYLASLDLMQVRAHNTGLADTLREKLGLPPAGSAIVAFEADPARVAEAGVVASVRDGKVRVGFHLYNTADDVERVLHAFG